MRRQVTVVLAALGLLLSACGDDDGGSPDDGAVGQDGAVQHDGAVGPDGGTPTLSGRVLFDDLLLNADGTGVTQLGFFSDIEANVRNQPATLSSDGAKLAVVGNNADPHATLFYMNVDGTGQVEVVVSDNGGGGTGIVYFTRPSFSPDDARLAFVAQSNQHAAVYTVGVDGTGLQLVTEATGSMTNYFNPTYSPDGTKIAYGDGTDLWLANADGSGTPANLGAGGNDPSFSPDGTTILVTRLGTSVFSAFAVKADGSGSTQVTDDAISANSVAFAPDGLTIMIAGADADPTNRRFGLFTANPDGTGLAILYDATTAYPNTYYHVGWVPGP